MEEKKIAGLKAAEFIKDGMVLGLGTGSTAFYMIEKVGQMVKEGLKIRAVATSQNTARLASQFEIPLISVDETDRIDLAIDGVDEIDRQFNAIKGGGGALFREKMVVNIAEKVIWIMDSRKLVNSIGDFPLPVEILPFGYVHIMKQLSCLTFNPVLRMNKETPFITDNGNYIVDLHIGKTLDIGCVSEQLKSVSGVLETGLFINLCDRMIVGTADGVKVIENYNKNHTLNGNINSNKEH